MKRMKADTDFYYSMSLRKVVYTDTRTDRERKRWWTKARTPGVTRKSRMPGGSGFRGYLAWEGDNG